MTTTEARCGMCRWWERYESSASEHIGGGVFVQYEGECTHMDYEGDSRIDHTGGRRTAAHHCCPLYERMKGDG